jgi:hypothetical protein
MTKDSNYYSEESVKRRIRTTDAIAKTLFAISTLALLALIVYAGAHMRRVSAEFDEIQKRMTQPIRVGVRQ